MRIKRAAVCEVLREMPGIQQVLRVYELTTVLYEWVFILVLSAEALSHNAVSATGGFGP